LFGGAPVAACTVVEARLMGGSEEKVRLFDSFDSFRLV
jgi:hypothetical protein